MYAFGAAGVRRCVRRGMQQMSRVEGGCRRQTRRTAGEVVSETSRASDFKENAGAPNASTRCHVPDQLASVCATRHQMAHIEDE